MCKPLYHYSANTLGIGANHAYKHDYKALMDPKLIIYDNKLSMLPEKDYVPKPDQVEGSLLGRAFSVYAHPMQYRQINKFKWGIHPAGPPEDSTTGPVYYYQDAQGQFPSKCKWC